MKRRRIIIAAVLVAFGALGIWRGPDLWWLLNHKRVYGTEGDGAAIGWGYTVRWSRDPVWDGPFQHWWKDTGFKYSEGLNSTQVFGVYLRCTIWKPDGTVRVQVRPDSTKQVLSSNKWAPPWWWGVTDQAEPSAPWIAAGITADEWWERVKPR